MSGSGSSWYCSRPDTKGNGPLQCPQPKIKRPIAISTGNKWLVEEDIGGPDGLRFERTYNSNPGTVPSVFGKAWRSRYSQFIGLGFTDAVWAYRPDGKSIRFAVVGSSFVPDADMPERLWRENGASGTLTGYRFLTGEGTVERYDTAGHLVSLTDAMGRTQTLAYDAQNRLAMVADAFGRSLAFAYDAQNRVAQVTGPAGSLTYGYDTNGNLASVTYPDGKVKTYLYEAASLPNALTGIVDENGGRYITYSYDSQGRAVGEVLAGNVESQQLAFGANQTTVTDPLGTQRTYGFQTVLGVVKSTGSSQPGGAGCGAASSTLGYDGNGNIASRTDFNGNVTTYTYDLARNLETQRVEAVGKPEQRTVSTQWHGYWRLPVKEAAPKKLTTWVYNGDTVQGSVVTCAPSSATVPAITGGTQPVGVLCSMTEQATADATGGQGFSAAPVGTPRTWTYTYNQYGQVLTADGPRTDVADVTTTTYYDAADPDLGKRGNLATVTDALGHVTSITAYDAHGNPLTVVDPNGVVTTLTYDLRQRLTARTVGGETTTYAYDAVGQLTRVTLPDLSYTAYAYDPAHRLTQISDALGNSVTYTLDAAGNRVQEEVRDPAGALARTRSRIYDALSRLAQEIGAQNQITAYEYDAAGNRTAVTDPLAHVTASAYDALNRLIAVTDPGTGVTRYGWDGQDRLLSVTDPRNLVTTYAVDGLGNATQQVSPDTGTTARIFDAAGDETARTDAKGQTTTTAYDALNRPALVAYADGRVVAYTWDAGPNGVGRLARVDEALGGTPVGSLSYAYDAQGRVTAETRTVGSVAQTVGYTYTGGQLSGLTYPSGRQVAYARDAAGRVTQVSLIEAGQTRVLAAGLTYAPFGGVTGWTDGAGQAHARSYDGDGRVASYTLGGAAWLVAYDAAGRVTGQVDGMDAANSALYTYDAQDRLTGATLPAAAYGYAYDAAGNRTSATAGAGNRPYTVDGASNRLLAVGGTPPTSYAHDANGSVTNDGTATYGYDARGRLVQATTAAGPTAYQLDARGRRVRKSGPGGDTLYAYDGAGHLLAESDGSGRVVQEVVWLGDTPIAVLQ